MVEVNFNSHIRFQGYRKKGSSASRSPFQLLLCLARRLTRNPSQGSIVVNDWPMHIENLHYRTQARFEGTYNYKDIWLPL